MTPRGQGRHIDTHHTFAWVRLGELQTASTATPWGRPVREGDARVIAADFDPDKFGVIAVWFRPDLEANAGRYIVIDGQHRVVAMHLLHYDDQKVPCLLYTGLTMETAAELSVGLQDRRNLSPLDRYRAELAAHDLRAIDVDKVLHHLNLTLAYSVKADDRGKISAISRLCQIWDVVGAAGLERVLSICKNAWENTSGGYQTKMLKLVMIVLAAHNGEVLDMRLSEVLGHRSPAQWVADTATKRPLQSVAQDVVIEYNRTSRGGNRLPELTPSEYDQAARRSPNKTVRGSTGQTKTVKQGRGIVRKGRTR
jgi:hypothetical protein